MSLAETLHLGEAAAVWSGRFNKSGVESKASAQRVPEDKKERRSFMADKWSKYESRLMTGEMSVQEAVDEARLQTRDERRRLAQSLSGRMKTREMRAWATELEDERSVWYGVNQKFRGQGEARMAAAKKIYRERQMVLSEVPLPKSELADPNLTRRAGLALTLMQARAEEIVGQKPAGKVSGQDNQLSEQPVQKIYLEGQGGEIVLYQLRKAAIRLDRANRAVERFLDQGGCGRLVGVALLGLAGLLVWQLVDNYSVVSEFITCGPGGYNDCGWLKPEP